MTVGKRLVLRDEIGTKVGTVEVRSGQVVVDPPWLSWVRTVLVVQPGVPGKTRMMRLYPEHGTPWLVALARMFKNPAAQPYIEDTDDVNSPLSQQGEVTV